MSRMFNFDALSCATAFAERGYVHIPNGLVDSFHARLTKYVDESFEKRHLKEFARGDKQQAMFEFLEPEHYEELREVVAAVCGVEVSTLTLSERHIKEYESDADPFPLAHKDRFGSEFAVGFSIRVPQGSTLVIYPKFDTGVNPFNSTAELRASFPPDMLPDSALKQAPRVEIEDHGGDVQIFRGSAMWHLREHGAGTVVLYLKFNTLNCDTLGEDPYSSDIRQHTLTLLKSSAVAETFPMVARRVDYIHRRYNRDWKELYGVVLYGQPHLTISQAEFRVLRMLDGTSSVAELSARVDKDKTVEDTAPILYRLAQRGIVDLLIYPGKQSEVHNTVLTNVA